MKMLEQDRIIDSRSGFIYEFYGVQVQVLRKDPMSSLITCIHTFKGECRRSTPLQSLLHSYMKSNKCEDLNSVEHLVMTTLDI